MELRPKPLSGHDVCALLFIQYHQYTQALRALNPTSLTECAGVVFIHRSRSLLWRTSSKLIVSNPQARQLSQKTISNTFMSGLLPWVSSGLTMYIIFQDTKTTSEISHGVVGCEQHRDRMHAWNEQNCWHTNSVNASSVVQCAPSTPSLAIRCFEVLQVIPWTEHTTFSISD
jgi:hypothetical protein